MATLEEQVLVTQLFGRGGTPYCVDDGRKELMEIFLRQQAQTRTEISELQDKLQKEIQNTCEAQAEMQRLRSEVHELHEAHGTEITRLSDGLCNALEQLNQNATSSAAEMKKAQRESTRENNDIRALITSLNQEVRAEHEHLRRNFHETKETHEQNLTAHMGVHAKAVADADARHDSLITQFAAAEELRENWRSGHETTTTNLGNVLMSHNESIAELANQARAEVETLRALLLMEVGRCTKSIEEEKEALTRLVADHIRPLEEKAWGHCDDVAQLRKGVDEVRAGLEEARQESSRGLSQVEKGIETLRCEHKQAIELCGEVAQKRAADLAAEAEGSARKFSETLAETLRAQIDAAAADAKLASQRLFTDACTKIDSERASTDTRLNAITDEQRSLSQQLHSSTNQLRGSLETGLQTEQRRTQDLGAMMLAKHESLVSRTAKLETDLPCLERQLTETQEALSHTKSSHEQRMTSAETKAAASHQKICDEVRRVECDAAGISRELGYVNTHLTSELASLAEVLDQERTASEGWKGKQDERLEKMLQRIGQAASAQGRLEDIVARLVKDVAAVRQHLPILFAPAAAFG